MRMSGSGFTNKPNSHLEKVVQEQQQPLQQSQQQRQPPKRKRTPGGNPDPGAEVVELSVEALLAPTQQFVCEVCSKGFQRSQNLQLHLRSHNLPWTLRTRGAEAHQEPPPRKKAYVCPVMSCVNHDPSRALGDITGIKKHYSRKHGEKVYRCRKCERKYAIFCDWKAHEHRCRFQKCECGEEFRNIVAYGKHLQECPSMLNRDGGGRRCVVTAGESSCKVEYDAGNEINVVGVCGMPNSLLGIMQQQQQELAPPLPVGEAVDDDDVAALLNTDISKDFFELLLGDPGFEMPTNSMGMPEVAASPLMGGTIQYPNNYQMAMLGGGDLSMLSSVYSASVGGNQAAGPWSASPSAPALMGGNIEFLNNYHMPMLVGGDLSMPSSVYPASVAGNQAAGPWLASPSAPPLMGGNFEYPINYQMPMEVAPPLMGGTIQYPNNYQMAMLGGGNLSMLSSVYSASVAGNQAAGPWSASPSAPALMGGNIEYLNNYHMPMLVGGDLSMPSSVYPASVAGNQAAGPWLASPSAPPLMGSNIEYPNNYQMPMPGGGDLSMPSSVYSASVAGNQAAGPWPGFPSAPVTLQKMADSEPFPTVLLNGLQGFAIGTQGITPIQQMEPESGMEQLIQEAIPENDDDLGMGSGNMVELLMSPNSPEQVLQGGEANGGGVVPSNVDGLVMGTAPVNDDLGMGSGSLVELLVSPYSPEQVPQGGEPNGGGVAPSNLDMMGTAPVRDSA